MNKNFRYLQLGKFFPPNWGGIETVTFNLLSGLTFKGIVNSAIVFGDSNINENYSTNGNNSTICRVKYFKLFDKPFSFRYMLTFRDYSKNFDIVIIHLPNPIAALALLYSGFNGRVILYWHSDIINKGFLGYLLRPLERWLIKRSNVIIGPTSAHLKYSRHAKLMLPKGKIIPFPIDRRQLVLAEYNLTRNRNILQKDLVKLIAIGRLVEYKGLEFLIRAIPIISNIEKIQLDILGDGPLINHLRSLVSDLGMSNRIYIHGNVSEIDRDKFLSEADIFCFPSINKAEMYGMVQIEAMAHGLPIIATDIIESGSPELTRLTGAGIIIAPSSSCLIAESIDNLIDNEDLYSKYSKAGLHAITNLFNPDLLIDKFCVSCEGL